jgi:DNA-binding response OmpR family regulator
MDKDNKNTILVIDDDRNILAIIELYLKKAGYEVKTCERGDTALQAFKDYNPALTVLDVMLPGLDGWGVLGKIRAESEVPVIMLTAKDAVADKVKGLDSGADDYITKPFAIEELLARVRAVFRKKELSPQGRSMLRIADLELDPFRHCAIRADRITELTKKEFDLLEYLIKNQGIILTRNQILENVWGMDYFGSDRVVDDTIRRLRKKMEEVSIETVYGYGYKLVQKP